ncbi:MAG: alkaline phosphatase family protein [Leptospirales bacterium]
MAKKKIVIYSALIVIIAVVSLVWVNVCSCEKPAYDHVVIVVGENHAYEQIIGSSDAPYINNILIKEGVLIENAYGEQHPSQPNYYWLFSGSNQGITTDSPYWPSGSPGPVFETDNLYTALEKSSSCSKSETSNFFGGYVDSGTDTPVADYYKNTPNYGNKHVPWLGFKNINDGDPAGITRDFGTTFPSGPEADFSKLPKVSFVIPALNHDMHDFNSNGGYVDNPEKSSIAIKNGDTWLQQNINAYAEWAKTHNSLLIVTFDEDSSSDWETPVDQGGGGLNGGTNRHGMTSPKLKFNPVGRNSDSGPNHIVMIFYGANLSKKGLYTVPGAGVNNVNLLRTIESFYGLRKSGAQTPLAIEAGMNDGAIEGIFVDR